MTEYAVSADKLTVGYKEPLISDICFNVKSGSIVVLIGPNGSGKSTILKTLSGYLKSLGGEIFFDGTNKKNVTLKEQAKLISVMLTEKISPELMTCSEVAESGRYPYTGYFGILSNEDKKAVNDAVKLVGAEDFIEKNFSEVSDGQKQRVLLARAICQQTKILILDEPTSYLDIHHKIILLEAMRKIADEKKAAIIVSMHEVELAEKIADYVICVKDGDIIYSGMPKEIFCEENICKLFDIPKNLYNKYYKSGG